MNIVFPTLYTAGCQIQLKSSDPAEQHWLKEYGRTCTSYHAAEEPALLGPVEGKHRLTHRNTPA